MAAIRLRFIVEGVHDEHVIGHLLLKHGIINPQKRDVDFRPKNNEDRNKDYVLANIPRLLDPEAETDRPIQKFALILDSEDGPANRWRDIRKAIGRPISDAPNPEGTIVSPDLGIWLMPDNVVTGSLEEFFETLIPSDDSLWQHATEVVPAVPDNPRRFVQKQLNKARVNSWLSWRNPPGLPMGVNIKEGLVRHDSELALRFVNWVNRLLRAE